MTKKFVIVIAAIFCLFAAAACSNQPVSETPFKVGGVYYESLQKACDAALADSTGKSIVELVKDTSGPGIQINCEAMPGLPTNSLVIGFGSHSYTFTDTKASSGAYFDVSGIILSVSGENGKLKSSGTTFFSADNTQIVLGPGLTIEVPSDSYFAELKNNSAMYADAYFNESINGNVKLDNSMLAIDSEKGSITIDKLEISGSASKLVFDVMRTTENTVINKVVIDSQSAPAIPITTTRDFTTEEYDEIDKIFKSGEKVHRHTYNELCDRTAIEAHCSMNRFDAYKCTNPDCNFVDIREIENTKDPTKHNLVHLDEVAPTATTSGNIECYKCDRCCQYFGLDGSSEPIDAIILAKDNVPYAQMVAGGISDLNSAVAELEEKVGEAGETKNRILGIGVSDILGALGTAFQYINDLEDTTREDIKSILAKLDALNGDVHNVYSSINNLLAISKSNTEYTYVSTRTNSLRSFYNKTHATYSAIIHILANGETEAKIDEIKEMLYNWTGKDTRMDILDEPATLLQNATDLTPGGRNYFEAYDYIGRSATGWEKNSINYRVAMRSLEMDTMLEGYKMVKWYFKYCYVADTEAKEIYKTTTLNTLESSWMVYQALYNANLMMTNSPTQATCWLSDQCYTFSIEPKLTDYAAELSNHKSDYNITADDPDITKQSIDKLIGAVDGQSVSNKFFEELYVWNNNNRSRDIYTILEDAGFNSVGGTRLSECYDKQKFIVADPGRDEYKEDYADSHWYQINDYYEASYKMIKFGQNSNTRNEDWLAIGSALKKDASLEVQKIYYESNFRWGSGSISNLGTGTGYTFFKLKSEKFVPTLYEIKH